MNTTDDVLAICVCCQRLITDRGEYEHGLFGPYPHCSGCDRHVQAESTVYAERDAALAVLRQLVAADDLRRRLTEEAGAGISGDEARDWIERANQANAVQAEAADAARRLLASGAPDNAANHGLIRMREETGR